LSTVLKRDLKPRTGKTYPVIRPRISHLTPVIQKRSEESAVLHAAVTTAGRKQIPPRLHRLGM